MTPSAALEQDRREMPIIERAQRVIAGKKPDEQLAVLVEYVDQAIADRLPEDELNALRRLYIRYASEVYRTRHYG